MRAVSIILCIALGYLALVEGTSIRCQRACTREFNPVCAVWKRSDRTSVCTFPTKCVLDNQRCRGQGRMSSNELKFTPILPSNTVADWVIMRMGECSADTGDCDDLRRRE
ncbi:hypothetical protein KR018_006094 [Drosophila ironensis]|nr:hypothetical protein KR018_006094 [Drosophila ironensis]